MPGMRTRSLARRVAQKLGWLPVLDPGPIPDRPFSWRIGPPDFVGVGVQKAGTTWWFSLIESHPEVTERARKELHFFADFWRRDFRHDHITLYHRYFPRADGTLSGEWTPRYMFDFWTPSLLKRAAPDAKILVLLRDPVMRYVSGLTVGLEGGAPPFHPAVAQDAMARGFYFAQLTHLLDCFSRAQVLVLQYEVCQRDVRGQLARTYEFLGIDSAFVPAGAEQVVNPTENKMHVPEETTQRLVECYREDVEHLAQAFPEIDLSLWPHFAAIAA
jgi:Sulfotransferase domain